MYMPVFRLSKSIILVIVLAVAWGQSGALGSPSSQRAVPGVTLSFSANNGASCSWGWWWKTNTLLHSSYQQAAAPQLWPSCRNLFPWSERTQKIITLIAATCMQINPHARKWKQPRDIKSRIKEHKASSKRKYITHYCSKTDNFATLIIARQWHPRNRKKDLFKTDTATNKPN